MIRPKSNKIEPINTLGYADIHRYDKNVSNILFPPKIQAFYKPYAKVYLLLQIDNFNMYFEMILNYFF